MKNGICPMCQSNQVHMTEDPNNLGSHGMVTFSGMVDREVASYHSDLYVCLTCGYMALFARPTEYKEKHQELTFLQKAEGWKKVV